MDSSAVYMGLLRRKSNTFGKLCSQKQQQTVGKIWGEALEEPV